MRCFCSHLAIWEAGGAQVQHFAIDALARQVGRRFQGDVHHGGGYEVIPREAALKIQERAPERIVQLNILTESQVPDEDDPYAAYQIPDDLMW